MYLSPSDTDMNNDVLIPGRKCHLGDRRRKSAKLRLWVIKLYLSCQHLGSTHEPKDGIICTAMFIAHGKASLESRGKAY
jgi:hypothetical protein